MDVLTPPLVLIISNDRAGFRSRLPLVEATRAAGYRVEAVLPPGEPIEGLVTHDWALDRRSLNPFKEVRALRGLAALVRRLKPDLVHCFTVKAMVYGGLVARGAAVPAVHTVTGLGYAFIESGPARRLLRLALERVLRSALGRSRRVLFQNADDRDLFVARGLVAPDRTLVVAGSGVDLQRFRPLPEPAGRVVVAFVGRLLADKGIHEFVAAARRLVGQGVPLRMVLLGDLDANPSSIDQAQLQAWTAEGCVEAWGWQAMPEGLAKVHIVCLPSYREGVPRALLEAAACARPVVTTDAPGCRDAVVAGSTGLLVPVRDDAALAAAIQRLAEDAGLRRRLGLAGRRLAEERFDARVVNQQTVSAYGAALAGR
ncbi:MAG: glycosyltransferase family 4 protein [Thermoplasmatota archaeon]